MTDKELIEIYTKNKDKISLRIIVKAGDMTINLTLDELLRLIRLINVT